MSTKNTKIKIRNDGNTAWIQLFPEITLAQITDSTETGRNLLSITTPSVDSFIRVNDDGSIDFRSGDQLRTDAGAAEEIHTHTTNQITDLDLSGKADLDVNGHLDSTQVPPWVLGGTKFNDIIETTTVTLNSTFFNAKDLTTGGQTDGSYFIITHANGCAVSFGADVEFTAGGDEGDTTSPIQLETGDWLVFSRYENSKWIFSVVNNRYGMAGSNVDGQRGIVRLANRGSRNMRSELDSYLDANKIVDESFLKGIMKDIHKGSAPASSEAGDLWLDYTP